MTKIDFYSLSRPIQDGLLDALGGQFTPRPILTRPGPRPSALGWMAVSCAAALGILILSLAGLGDVNSPLAIYSAKAAAAYALLAGAAALGVIQALAHLRRLRALPFSPGLFLFPANVIDARDHALRVYPLAELSSVATGPGSAITVRFGGGAFSFPVADVSLLPELVRVIEAARDRMKQGPDAEERRRLDPLEPALVESPLAPPNPLSRSAAPWERYAWPIAAALGAGLGLGIFQVRNVISDNKMFALARARDDVASYKGYAARGRRHVDEVKEVLLPRAELRLAMESGSVEAIDAFRAAYPKTGIEAEVLAAQRAALVGEFERTRKAGTLAALLSFADRYPKHGMDKAFAEQKHSLYQRALARYKAEMPKGAEPRAELVGRLLTYAERTGPSRTAAGLRGPAVQIRFQRLPSEGLTRAEEQVMKSPSYGGVMSLPTRHVTPEALGPHEQSAQKALAEGFAGGFDPEIVTFEPGPPGPPEEGKGVGPPAVSTPTLLVSYRVESSGAVYARSKPRGIFLGLVFFFNADFLLPGDAKPFGDKHKLLQRVPIDLVQQKSTGAAPGGVEVAVYEAMMRDAFVDFSARTLARWLAPPKNAK